MKPLAIADDHGSTFRIATCDDAGHAWIRVSDSHGQIASACVAPEAIPEVAQAMYEACGTPAPVMLERPEMPDTTALPGTHFTLGRPGFVDVKTSAGGRWNISSAALRHYAASLAMLADEADAALDPAEVDALAAAIMAELNPGAMGLDGARPYARAALRWMRDRAALDD